MANSKELKNTESFLRLVGDIKALFPEQDCKYAISGSLPSDPVASIWDKLGKDYINLESTDAMAATMYLLQEHGITEIEGRQTKWLSIGSGPSLYEFYLAKLLFPVEIDSLDISIKQLETGKKVADFLKTDGSRYEKSVHRVRPINASMDAIPVETGYYDRILLLNSLHWCVNWKNAIREVSRVLIPRKGARVYVVMASASIITAEGKKTLTPDLDTDSLLDQFEANGLVAKSIVNATILNGQYGRPTPRMFTVFERGNVPKEHWSDRIRSGQTKFGELTIFPDGTIQREKLNG